MQPAYKNKIITNIIQKREYRIKGLKLLKTTCCKNIYFIIIYYILTLTDHYSKRKLATADFYDIAFIFLFLLITRKQKYVPKKLYLVNTTRIINKYPISSGLKVDVPKYKIALCSDWTGDSNKRGKETDRCTARSQNFLYWEEIRTRQNYGFFVLVTKWSLQSAIFNDRCPGTMTRVPKWLLRVAHPRPFFCDPLQSNFTSMDSVFSSQEPKSWGHAEWPVCQSMECGMDSMDVIFKLCRKGLSSAICHSELSSRYGFGDDPGLFALSLVWLRYFSFTCNPTLTLCVEAIGTAWLSTAYLKRNAESTFNKFLLRWFFIGFVNFFNERKFMIVNPLYRVTYPVIILQSISFYRNIFTKNRNSRKLFNILQ